MLLEDYLYKVKKWKKSKKITNEILSEGTGLSRSTISRILNGDQGSFNSIYKMEEFILNYKQDE